MNPAGQSSGSAGGRHMSNGVSPSMDPGSKAGTDSQPSGHCQSAMAGGAGPVGTALFVLLVPSPTPLLIGSGSGGGSRSSPQPHNPTTKKRQTGTSLRPERVMHLRDAAPQPLDTNRRTHIPRTSCAVWIQSCETSPSRSGGPSDRLTDGSPCQTIAFSRRPRLGPRRWISRAPSARPVRSRSFQLPRAS